MGEQNIVKQYWREIGVSIILTAFYLSNIIPLTLYGPYNPDEGWYLYSAWQTWQGSVMYRDFAFPQPPLTILVHGFFQLILGPGFYIGRFVNAGISFLAIIAFSAASWRLWGKWSALCTALILIASPLWAVHSVSVSTYALAALFLGLELFFLAHKRFWWAAFFAVMVIATRLTLIPAAGIILGGSFLLYPTRLILKRILAGVGIGLFLILMPLVILAPQESVLNIINYHTYTRSDLSEQSTDVLIKQSIEFIQTDYWKTFGWFWILTIIGLIAAVWTRQQYRILFYTVLGAALLNAVFHAPAASITYDTPLVPLLAVLIGAGLGGSVVYVSSRITRGVILSVFIVLLVGVVTYTQVPLTGSENNHEETHLNIRRISHYITTHSDPMDYIFTPELYLAVEAGRRTLPGTELGRFFYFPKFTTEEAYARNLVNDERFQELVSSRKAAFIAVSMAQFWNNVEDHDHQHRLMSIFEAAGYAPVAELHTQDPVIEATRLYERQ